MEAPGFIQVRGETIAGIGVSRYQPDLDFEKAEKCGAQFALVRISSGSFESNEPNNSFEPHWRNAKGVGLLVAPYHSFSYAEAFGGQTPKLVDLNPDQLTRTVREAEERATASTRQSNIFLSRLDLLLASSPQEKVGSLRGRLFLDPILDLSVDPWAKAGSEVQVAVAPVMRAAACAFVKQLKQDPRFHIRRVIVFSTPAVWRTYAISQAKCDLGGDGIALSLMTRDGSSFIDKHEYSDICGSTGNNRCVMEHYTSFSSFLNFGVGNAAELVRFYGDHTRLEGRLNAID